MRYIEYLDVFACSDDHVITRHQADSYREEISKLREQERRLYKLMTLHHRIYENPPILFTPEIKRREGERMRRRIKGYLA